MGAIEGSWYRSEGILAGAEEFRRKYNYPQRDGGWYHWVWERAGATRPTDGQRTRKSVKLWGRAAR